LKYFYIYVIFELGDLKKQWYYQKEKKMNDFVKCVVCGEYDFKISHKCAPCWKATSKYNSENEYNKIFSSDYKEAAEKYVAFIEQLKAEFSVLDGDSLEVQIEPLNGGEKKTFIVTGELVPNYTAKEKK